MAGPIRIAILGNAASGVAAINTTAAATTRLSTKFKSAALAAAKFAAAGAAVGAGLAAYGAVQFAKAAVEDQKAAVQMAKAFKNAAGATGQQIAATEKWISAQGVALGITDDELRPALGRLVTAFGSVARATKLTALAENVSAGTGKSLEVITTGLARARNGSLAGLSRLGVATKNAAGETKTLSEITADLAQKYKGAAAAAAGTAAGKFQILKTRLTETGESIGYKLLPVITDLGDLLLTKGVPAVEALASAGEQKLGPVLNDLRRWVSENKDEMRDLGAQVVDTVIPALRTAGTVVGAAVSFFSRLPGPIKAIGIEAGLAAVVLPRLTSAINTMSTAVGLSTAKVAGWRKGLLLAAGVGGLVAISEGARTGNKAVGLLGAAMTGAFVGGTLGSAIPGVGTAIGAVGGAAVGAGIGLIQMHKAANAAGDASASATPKVEGLVESLNQTTGAATRATKALILQKLQEDGVVGSASKLGIATSDLIKSVLGNQKAIERVNGAWEKNGNLLDGLANNDISDWLAGLRIEVNKSETAVKDNNAALNGTDRAARKAADALKLPGKDRPSTNKWQALYSGDLNKATDDTSTMARSTRRLLGEEIGKARANMGPFSGDLIGQLGLTKGRANTAGRGIGTSIKSGVTSGLGGLLSSVVATVNNAIAAAQAAAGRGGGGGGGKGRGGSTSDSQQREAAGRVSEKLGRYTAERFASGVLARSKDVEDAVSKVGDKAVKKAKEKAAQLRDQLATARSDFASLVEPISANFTQGLFEFDSASSFTSNLATVKGTLTTVMANFKKLIGEGLSPGFLYRLFQEGGPALINDLASLDQASAQAAGGLYGEVMALSNQLGTAVAGSTDKGAGLEKQTRRIETALDKVVKAVDDGAKRTDRNVSNRVAQSHLDRDNQTASLVRTTSRPLVTRGSRR